MGRKQQLEQLKKVLLKRRDALRKAIEGDWTLLNELRDQGGDLLDLALDSSQGELNSQLMEAESRELAQIERAIERFDAGTYGLCEVTGKPIPLARLQALPYATLCIEAQRALEKRGLRADRNGDWSRVLEFSDEEKEEIRLADLEVDA